MRVIISTGTRCSWFYVTSHSHLYMNAHNPTNLLPLIHTVHLKVCGPLKYRIFNHRSIDYICHTLWMQGKLSTCPAMCLAACAAAEAYKRTLFETEAAHYHTHRERASVDMLKWCYWPVLMWVRNTSYTKFLVKQSQHTNERTTFNRIMELTHRPHHPHHPQLTTQRDIPHSQ